MTDQQAVVPQSRTELWRLEQLALISQVVTQVTSIYDLDELLVRVVGLIYQTFEFYAVSLFILEEDSLVIRAQAGPSDSFAVEDAFIPQDNSEIPLGEGVIGWVAAHQQELVVSDVWREKRFRYSPEFPKTEAEIALPLKVEDRILGVLDVQLDYPEDFDEIDLLVLRTLAGQVSMAVEDTRLYWAAQQEAKISNALLKVAESVEDFEELDQALLAITQIASLVAEVDRCAIWLRPQTSDLFDPSVASGFTAEALEFFNQYSLVKNDVAALKQLDQTREPLVMVDAQGDGRLPFEMVSGLELQTLVLLPIVAHSEMLGVMMVTCQKPSAIREDDIRLFSGIAHQASVAIESKFLYEQKLRQERLAHELELAHDIQTSLLPSDISAPPGWEVAAFWQAAQEVSGDFYDLMEVGPAQLGIVIADVAGKGMPAALYMALTRSLIRATAYDQADPRAVLKRTNQLLIPDTRRGKFVSLFYAVLDTQSGALTYANAGHNPPLLMRADGQVEVLRVQGMVLGVKPEIESEIGYSQLEPGDGVVFYTDGVTEVFNAAADIFGQDRLKHILQTHWGEGPHALVAKIRQAVNDFSASPVPHDDFTLLILQRSERQ